MARMKTHRIMTACFIVFACFGGSVSAKSFPPLPQALEAMESDAAVTVRKVEVAAWGDVDNYFYAFEPSAGKSALGFIIYPGAMVDPRAYAPAAHRIAAKGFLAIIVKMPGDMGFYGLSRANEIIPWYEGVTQWVIGGHSDGGAMACSYAGDNTDRLAGVVIWASFPSEMFRLDDTDLMAVSIYGSEDGFVEEIRQSEEHLPEGTVFVEIQGGNHTQFGWYDTGDGPQPGDGTATISREEQQDIIVKSTTDFLAGVVAAGICPAAAVLGVESPRLETLRIFRDDVLARSETGRALIRCYYRNAAALTAALQASPALNKGAGVILEALMPAIAQLPRQKK